MRRLSTILALPLLFLSGCPSTQGPARTSTPSAPPIMLQLRQQDNSLESQKFRTLLDFERETDLAFVTSDGPLSADRTAHTGQGAMQARAASVNMRISSVLFGARLPGEWSLLGCYVRPEVDTAVHITLSNGAQTLARGKGAAVAGQWSFISIDLTTPALAAALENAEQLTLRLDLPDIGSLATTNIDDVLLINNETTLVDTLETGAGGWSISRKGFNTKIDAPGRFTITAVAAAVSERGWLLAEYGPMRAILRSAGPVRNWTIYNDGRWIEDGKMSVKGASGDAAIASHQSPGDVWIDEASGRLDRHTPGDMDNDGYNEQRGAYQVVARSPRLQLKLTPVKSAIASPVLEITGLPAGSVATTVEGLLVEHASRLPDGRVLINLPLRFERPTQVTVRTTSDNGQ